MKRATDRLSSLLPCLLGLLGGLLLAGAPAPAQAPALARGYTVQDVLTEGNFQVPAQRVVALIQTKPGAEYNQAVVNEDVRKLYATRQFRDVRVQVEQVGDPQDRQVKVLYKFAEYPGAIQEIVYQGNNHAKPKDLDAVTGLRRDAPMNPIQNRLACQAIQRFYQEKGRPFAHVELVEGGQAGDQRVVFNITEGPIVRVKGIAFTGSHFVSGPVLATHLDSSKAFLGLLGGHYNPAMADHDVLKLEDYYKSYGFHDVRVERDLDWSADLQYVTLVYHVREGERYKVTEAQVSAPNPRRRDELEALAKWERGKYYNEQESKKKIQEMKDRLGYQGIDATVIEKPVYLDPAQNPGLMAVNYQVIERPAARVKEVKIIGNDVTRDNVIRRQVPLYPGQILTYPDLRIAEANLARLGIFEVSPENGIKPTVTVDDSENPDSPFKDVIVQVQETRTGSLLFGLGVNSDSGLTGSIVLNERNFDLLNPPRSLDDLLSGRAFRGAGQEFRAEAVPGTQAQRYSVSFREPFLFDSLYSLKVDGYYYTRFFDEYRENRLGTRVTVGRRLNDIWSVSGTTRVEDVGVHNVLSFAPIDFQEVVGHNFQVALRAGVNRDTRDSYLRPTEGGVVDLSFEQFFGEFVFPKINLEANRYFTLYQRADGSGRHVLALRSQVAWAGHNAPVYERYYAGGFQSLRGFSFRGVGPDVNGFKVGGTFEFLNSVEYQLPIKANDRLFLVAFVDSGTVERDVEINDYRVSAGVGARIQIPMLGPVPIALDFGFPIVKADADHRQIFSFWLGFFH